MTRGFIRLGRECRRLDRFAVLGGRLVIHGGHGRVLHPPPEALQLVHPHLAHEGGAGFLPVVPEVVLNQR